MVNLELKNKINIPFAEQGDKIDIPETASDGTINFTDGLSTKYETPIAEGGEYITREDINSIFYKIYVAMKEMQELAMTAGFPIDMTKALNVLPIENGGTGGSTPEEARNNLQTFNQEKLPNGADLNNNDLYQKNRIVMNLTGFNHTNFPGGAQTGEYITYLDPVNKRGWQRFYPAGLSETGQLRYAGRIFNNGVWEEWKWLRNADGSIPKNMGGTGFPVGAFPFSQKRIYVHNLTEEQVYNLEMNIGDTLIANSILAAASDRGWQATDRFPKGGRYWVDFYTIRKNNGMLYRKWAGVYAGGSSISKVDNGLYYLGNITRIA